MNIYCGIDPGKTGALAIFCPKSSAVTFFDTPNSLHDQGSMIIDVWLQYHPAMTMIEQVNPFGMGKTSAFTFGHGVGVWEGAMAAASMPYQFISPQKWQKATCGAHPKELSKKEKAARVYEWLVRQLPNAEGMTTPKGKIIDGRVDALALAIVASRQ